MATSIDELTIRISASTSEATKNIGKLVSGLKHLQDALSQINVSDINGVSSALSSVSESLKGISGSDASKTVSDVAKSLSSVNHSADVIGDMAKNMNDFSQASSAANDGYGKLERTLESTTDSANKIKGIATAFRSINVPLKSVSASVSDVKTKLANLKIIIPTKGLEEVKKSIKSVKKEYDSLRKEMKKYIEDGAYKGGVDEERYHADVEKLAGLRNEYDKLMLKQEQLSRNGGYRLNTEPIEKFKKALSGITTKMQKVFASISNLGTSIKNTFSNAIGKIRDFSRGINEFAKKQFSAAKGMMSTYFASSKLLKNIVRINKMLRLMITRKILQAIIRNAIDGFKNMVQYSSKFDASVSLLWNSFKQLGNALDAMVAPLLNKFAPAINKVIQLLIQACNWVNQLFSALTGATTWTKAKELTGSYADSLDETGKSAKKLNKQLQGFDALNNLTTSDSKSAEITPDEMFEDVEVENKFKDLAKKLKDIWNDIIDPIKKAWNKVGSFVVDAFKNTFNKLKKMFKTIAGDWMKVWKETKTQRMFEKIFVIIGRIVNLVGILADKFTEAWKYNNNGLRFLEAIRDILYVIVDWIQKAVERTETWAKHLDLKPLFSSITSYMESLVKVVDTVMSVLYNFYSTVLLPLSKWTLEKGLPQLFDIFTKMNNEIDWDGLKTSLSKLFQALEPLGETIGQGLIDFIGYLSGKLTEFLNSNLFDKIVSGITDFIDFLNSDKINIDTTKLDQSFTSYLESLEPVVDDIIGIFKDFYSEFLKPIAEWTIGEGLPKLLDCFTELNNMGLFEDLRDALSNLWQILAPFARKVGEGLIIFIEDAGKAVHEFFGSDEWKKFVDSMKSFVDDIKPQQVADGLTKIFKALLAYGMIKTVVTVFTPIVSFITSIIGFGAKVAEIADLTGAIENLASAFSSLGTAFKSVADSVFIIENIKGLFAESKKIGKLDDALAPYTNGTATAEDAQNLSNAVKELEQSSKNIEDSSRNWGGFFKELFLGDVSKAGEMFRQLNGETRQTNKDIETLNKALDSGMISQKEYNRQLEEWSRIGKDVSSSTKEVTVEFESVSTEVAKAGGSMSTTLVTLEKDVSNSTSNITSTMQGVKPEFSEKNWTFEDVAKGLEETFRSAYSRVTKLLEQLREKLKWEIGQLKLNMTSFVDWIEKEIFPNFSKETWTFSGLAEGLSDSFDSAIKICKQKWNAFAKELNSMVELTVDPISMNGENIYEGGQFKLFTLPTFSTGGFPENGLFMANSTEMVGKFSNGKNAVANNEQIVDGIAQGVASANSEQNMLLRQQNSLLQAILEKETGISSDALFRSVQNSANSYYKRTGRYAFN